MSEESMNLINNGAKKLFSFQAQRVRVENYVYGTAVFGVITQL